MTGVAAAAASDSHDLPVLFALHGLGGSARTFDRVRDALADTVEVVAIDLPGFGDEPALAAPSVGAVADHVVGRLRSASAGRRWLLAGHSMGGKIAAVVASRVLAGDAPVFGLAGVVLLAPSPVTPEPIDDERRKRMLSWTADGPLTDAQAREFVDQNVAEPLPTTALERALGDLERTSPAAWEWWLTAGADEDLHDIAGALDLPALVIAGADDEDLGADAQPRLASPTFPRARFVSLADTGHLLPLERPAEVADAVRRFVADEIDPAPRVGASWARLIASDRTDAQTRGILARRAVPDDARYVPTVTDAAGLTLLRELAETLVPQDGAAVDLAARVDAQLTQGRGDGWRHTDLPDDRDALRLGLRTIAPLWPADRAGRTALIRRARDGDIETSGPLTASQIALWLEDLCNDLVRHWLAHPAVMERIGFDGFATAGTVVPLRGFAEPASRREDWEPAGVDGLERSA